MQMKDIKAKSQTLYYRLRHMGVTHEVAMAAVVTYVNDLAWATAEAKFNPQPKIEDKDLPDEDPSLLY